MGVALVLLAATTTVASAHPDPPCSRVAATKAVVNSTLPKRWKDAVRGKYGPYEGIGSLTCGKDLTADHVADMALTFSSGGTAGDVAWAVFRRASGVWKLALTRLDVYKLRLDVLFGDPIETVPVYKRDDANCCPTGGYDHTRWHWNGKRFVVIRNWHDKSWKPD